MSAGARTEFPAAVRLAAWRRCKGKCERCTAPLVPGKFVYDHDLPDYFGGTPTLDNCVVACDGCDSVKTYTQDIPAIAKSKRIERKHAGIKKRPSSLRATGLKWSNAQGRFVERKT